MPRPLDVFPIPFFTCKYSATRQRLRLGWCWIEFLGANNTWRVNMRWIVGLLLAVILGMTGCESFSTGRYSISTDNVVALRSFSNLKLNIGEFTAEQEKYAVNCVSRGDIRTQDGESYTKFIQKAFSDELKMAGIYSSSAPVTITGRLNYNDASYFEGQWKLVLTVKSST